MWFSSSHALVVVVVWCTHYAAAGRTGEWGAPQSGEFLRVLDLEGHVALGGRGRHRVACLHPHVGGVRPPQLELDLAAIGRRRAVVLQPVQRRERVVARVVGVQGIPV